MVATGYVGHDPTLVPKTTQVIAGSGLSGGGPLAADITLVNTGGGGGGVPSNRQVNTTAPLTGGGDLSADRTLAVSSATAGAVGVIQLAGDLAGPASAPTVPGLAGKQPLDATLTNFAALTGAGFVIATATDTFTMRSLAAGSTMVTITNPQGVLGNPTIDVAPGNFSGIPESGVTNLVADLANKQPLDAGLTSLAGLASTGIVAATAADTYTQRSIVAGSTKLTVTNGAGIAGNPSIDIGTLLAADIPALDASKITTGVFSGNRLPLISTPNLISGAWYTVPGFGGTGTINPANNVAILVCLVPLRDCTLSGLAVEITTPDSSGVIRFGRASDSSGVPGSWLDDFGTVVATGAASVVQPASTPNVALTAGTRYWLGVVGQGLTSGLALRSRNSSDPNVASTLVSTATPPAPSAIRNAITSSPWSGALSGALGSLAVTSGCAIIARLT